MVRLLATLAPARIIPAPRITDTHARVAVPTHGAPSAPLRVADLASGVASAANDPLHDVRLMAEQLIADARAEAEGLLTAARIEAEQLKTQSRREGLQLAREEAQGQVRAEAATLLQALRDSAADYATAGARFASDEAAAVLDLATILAERILRAQLSLEPVRLQQLLAEVLAPLKPLPQLTIHAHPSDASMLHDCAEALTLEGVALAVRIATDPALPHGTLRCEFAEGDCDASIPTQVARLSEALRIALIEQF